MNSWEVSSIEPITWGQAFNLENRLVRLPTLSELKEAFSDQIKGFEKETYWTGESKENDKYNVWVFDFATGKQYYLVKSNQCFARLLSR